MARLGWDGIPESERGRVRLTVRDPDIEKLLCGLAIESEKLQQIRDYSKGLWAERNRFDVRRRVGGLFVPDRRLDKGGAERLLRSMLADLAIGGGE